MRFDLITIFPEFFFGPFDHGILRRARETGLVEVNVQDLRVFTKDRHRTVGDRALRGGELPAMVVVDAVTRLIPGALGNEASSQNESFSAGPASRATSPQGKAQHAAPLLGETVDALGRMNLESPTTNHVLLDFPHYTRPAEYRGWGVPEVLIGGNHAEVAKWRRAAALEKTRTHCPDLG